MDRPPLPKKMADELRQGPERYSPQPSTSSAAMQLIREDDEPVRKRSKVANKKPTIDHEAILAAHREATYHGSIKAENGRRLIKAKFDDVEANKTLWREQNGPWDFTKEWGEKQNLKLFSNFVTIKRGEDEVKVQPRIAFRWFLALQSEKLDYELIKQEWIKLSSTEKEEKMFDEIVWSDNRSCYCKTRKFKEVYEDRGDVHRESLDSLVATMGTQFRYGAKKEKQKIALQTPTLIPHGLTDEEMNEKYILKLDEYGCVPLDGDWYWGLWSSPRTAEDKLKLSLHEKAGRLYCQRICIPVQYEGHRYMVGLETAFKLWLDKQTDPVVPREMLDEEYERIKGLESHSIENIEWGERLDGGYGYGTKDFKYSRLVSFHDTRVIKTNLVPTSSSDPPHGMVDGTLRLKPLAPAERMTDVIEDPFEFEGAKSTRTALLLNLQEANTRIDEKDVTHIINKTKTCKNVKNVTDQMIHYDGKYLRPVRKSIGQLRSLQPVRFKKTVFQERVKNSVRIKGYHVYMLLLLHKSKTTNKSLRDIFDMLTVSGIQQEDKVYVGKRTGKCAPKPQPYHKLRPEISSVGKLLLTGDFDAFEIATISCASKEEQERLEGFIYFFLVMQEGLGQLSVVNKMTVMARLKTNDIEHVFQMAENGETKLVNFSKDAYERQGDVFELNYTCNRLDFHLYQQGFWGPRCQYQDECESEAECSNNGKCIDLGGTSLPRKQCFCNVGFYGEKCRKRNSVKLPTSAQPLDLTRHTKRVLSDRLTLHYRILPSAKEKDKEIEFILLVKGTSYGALGWRPIGFDKKCQRWPFIDNSTAEVERQGKNAKLESSSSSDNSAIAEPESGASEPASEPVSKHKKSSKKNKDHDAAHAEPESEPESDSVPEPEGTAEPETTSEPESEPVKTTQKPKSGADKLKAKLRSHRVQNDGSDVHVETSQIVVTRSRQQRQRRSPEEASAEPEPESEPEGQPEAEPHPESSEPEPEGSAKSEPNAEAEAEAEAEPGASESNSASVKYGNKKDLKASVWAPKGDFHAMDCIDLVMGAARGPLSRIRDYYTRDRSTPRLDGFWGGTEDLTAATGWEDGDQTVLIFRRKLLASDEADHSIAGEMHVIWARGQEKNDYVHKPHSGLEKESPSKPEFYAPDEIKYHGHGGQRGITRIDFLVEQTTGKKKTKSYDCENGWAHPPGCSNYGDPSKPCSYNATWRYIPETDSVKFTIETRKPDRWTGIAFSDTPQMRNSDAVIGWVASSGQFFHMDTFMTSYTAPVLDNSQDISNMTGKYRDGIVHWSFIRKVKTSDSSKDVSLDECRFFLFPVEGGTYNHVNKKIRKHEQLPIASAEKICIPRECRPVRIKVDPELKYEFDVKLTGGLGNNWRPPRKESEDFKHLENRIGAELGSELRNIKGFKRLLLSDIKRDGKAGALAKLELMVVPDSELAQTNRVERALNDTLNSGKVGAFQIDPTYLRLKAPVLEQTDYEEDESVYVSSSPFGSQRLWIVIGCVAALILLALIQAILTIYKVSGKPSSHKGSNSSGMAWRDYSETNFGYDAYDDGKNSMQLQTNPQIQYPANGHNGHNGHSNGNGYGVGVGVAQPPPSMSLPRPHHGGHSSIPRGGGGGAPGLSQNPDFYFMPSQRKYSGEMVRVYVDHNKR